MLACDDQSGGGIGLECEKEYIHTPIVCSFAPPACIEISIIRSLRLPFVTFILTNTITLIYRATVVTGISQIAYTSHRLSRLKSHRNHACP